MTAQDQDRFFTAKIVDVDPNADGSLLFVRCRLDPNHAANQFVQKSLGRWLDQDGRLSQMAGVDLPVAGVASHLDRSTITFRVVESTAKKLVRAGVYTSVVVRVSPSGKTSATLVDHPTLWVQKVKMRQQNDRALLQQIARSGSELRHAAQQRLDELDAPTPAAITKASRMPMRDVRELQLLAQSSTSELRWAAQARLSALGIAW